jgi:hemolysin activation/secretion protein
MHWRWTIVAFFILVQPVTLAQTAAPDLKNKPSQAAPLKSIPVTSIQISGSTIFTSAELAKFAKDYENRNVTIAELQTFTESLTQRYLDRGYLSSRAVLVDQTLTSGIVQIRIIEGRLERIDIQGTHRVSKDYILNRLKLADHIPLNQTQLETQLRLLKLDPLFNQIEASLKEGSSLGTSILKVQVNEAPALSAKLTIDNGLNPTIGEETFSVYARTLNLTGSGDSLDLAYSRSFTGGANLASLQYQLPINPMQGTITARIAPSQYKITNGDLRDLNIEGNSQSYDLIYRQPLIRSPREEFALSLGWNYRTGQTLIFNQLANASSSHIVRFGQDYLRRDMKGLWSIRSSLDFGLPTDSPNSHPNSQFFAWTGQLQRLTTLGPNQTLIAQTRWQFTPNPLLPSAQFSLGGVGNLRGYRSGITSGDNGFSFSLENQITLDRNTLNLPTVQIVPFVDIGKVWNSGGDRSTETQLFASLGSSLRWSPSPRIYIQLDAALPLTTSQNRGNGLQDAGIYFSTQYSF